MPRTYTVQKIDNPAQDPTTDDDFGIGFVNAGDIDKDGKDDIIVGTDEHGGSEGQVVLLSGKTGSLIRAIKAPDTDTAAGGGTIKPSFGSYVGKIADLGSCPGGTAGQTCGSNPIGAADGVPDLLVTALGLDVPTPGAPNVVAADIGRAYVIDGATGAILKRIDMPLADRLLEATQSPAQKPAFGRTILSPAAQYGPTGGAPPADAVQRGDLDGGGQPDILVGASDFYETGPGSNPACSPGPCLQAGREYMYRGEDIAGSNPNTVLDTPAYTIKNPTAQSDDLLTPVNTNRESMGYSIEPVGDVGKCNAAAGAGALCANANSTGTPDGRPDYVLSSHRTDMFGMFDVGVAYLVDGPTGQILYTYTHPEPQPASIFAFTNYNQPAPGDLGASTTPDVYLPAMRQNVQFTGQGKGYVMNGQFKQPGSPNNINFAQLNDPTPNASENFGTSSAGIGNVAGDARNEILIGAYGPHNPGTNTNVINDVQIFSALDEKPLYTFQDPDQQPGSGFGTALAPMGDLNDDGFLDFAIGAGLFDNAVGANEGRIYIFRSDNSPPPAPPSPPPPPAPPPAPPPPPPPAPPPPPPPPPPTPPAAPPPSPPPAPPPAACVVPRVTGKGLAAARSSIARAHCRVGSLRRTYSSKVKLGRVLSQRPAAGKRLKAGGRVNLLVSRGKRP